MQAMSAMERTENATGRDVLFILEEFPTLGYMRQLEAAAGLMAGYQVKLWTVMQDLSQIKALYPNSWETFIGNAGIIEAFGNSDATTTEYLSKRLGTTLAIQQQPENQSLQAQAAGAPNQRETIVTVPLMAPYEITQAFNRDNKNKLIIWADGKPFALKRVFWKDLKNGG
jgi:type IV secretion system protein VirD4